MAIVVVVEDDDDIRHIAAHVLRKDGHQVSTAVDGAQALRLIEQQEVDIVVSDIDMPTLSGVDLCLAIRAKPELKELPVVLVSGSLRPGDDRAERAQATAMLHKPFGNSELLACVRETLRDGHQEGMQPLMYRRSPTAGRVAALGVESWSRTI